MINLGEEIERLRSITLQYHDANDLISKEETLKSNEHANENEREDGQESNTAYIS